MAHKFMRLMVLFLIPLGSYAQQKKALYIGDTIPSLTFTNVFHNSGKPVSLDDFRGKLVILDFWNRWCHACVASFPEMEKLQNRFGDKIKILLVTSDADTDLVKLFKRVKLPDLPIIFSDTVLNKLFPHTTVPQHVWITAQGRVQFITDGYNSTNNNIAKAIEGDTLSLHLKREVSDFKSDEPLWKEGNGRLQKYITAYSFGMNRIEENTATASLMNKDSANKTVGFKFLNIPLLDLYKMAFGNSLFNSVYNYSNRIIFDMPEKDNWLRRPVGNDGLNEWAKKNLVCYESHWSAVTDSTAFLYLQNDVNKFFPFLVKVEDRQRLCYLLKVAGKQNAKNREKESIPSSDNDIELPVNSSILLENLNELKVFENTPVFDETQHWKNTEGQLYNIYIDLKCLEKQLLKNGLVLVPATRKVRTLVIALK